MSWLITFLLLAASSISYAGDIQKVPAPAPAASAAVYDSRTFRLAGAEQEDFDGSDWICMHRTPIIESVSGGYFGTSTTTHFLTTYDCYGTGLRDWDEDTTGSWRYNDAFKPAGVKWTATKLECMLTFPLPTSSPVDTEDLDFKVGWRDGDSVGVDTTTVTLDSNDAGGVSVTATPNFEIGVTADVASMVVLANIDTAASGDLDNINAVCMVTLKVE